MTEEAQSVIDRPLRDELAASERELAAIYAHVPGILFYVAVDLDGEFRFLSMSDGGLIAMGMTREQVVGSRVRDIIPPPSRDKVLNYYREAIRSGQTVRWEEESVYPAGRRHGEVAVTPLHDSNGVATRLIGIVHDITQRKAAEAALGEADARKTEFIASLSHELRNPLAAITNNLAVLDVAGGDSDAAVRARAIVGRQVAHMTRLVDDLLDITRITRGTIELHRESIELGTLLRRAIEEHMAAFSSHRITCQIELPGTSLWLDADATRLTQVIGNLLSNAIKFTPPGGRVTASLAGEHETAVLRIRDTGIGIDRDLLNLLFVPFKQARQPLDLSATGLGLGLMLVKSIVELHGGAVAAASDGPDRGTEITVRLPLTPAHIPIEAAPPPRVAGTRRVLVIEDHVDVAEGLRALLEHLGHEVQVSADGPSGIAKAGTFRPNVILCDLGLPGMSGYDVARAIRCGGTSSPLLVALSGHVLPQDRERSAAVGFAHHIAKPSTLADLERVIAAARAE
jgi:PAS domain S-box-containing protein